MASLVAGIILHLPLDNARDIFYTLLSNHTLRHAYLSACSGTWATETVPCGAAS